MMRMGYLVLLKIILCFSLGILQSGKSLAKDDEIKPEEVVVRVRKKIPPVPGNLDDIEVEVKRKRK